MIPLSLTSFGDELFQPGGLASVSQSKRCLKYFICIRYIKKQQKCQKINLDHARYSPLAGDLLAGGSLLSGMAATNGSGCVCSHLYHICAHIIFCVSFSTSRLSCSVPKQKRSHSTVALKLGPFLNISRKWIVLLT